VYPLSLKYSRATIAKVLLYRYCFLLLFIYLLVPFDLYINQDEKRISYIASTWYKHEFSPALDNLTISTTNCHIYLYSDLVIYLP